MVVYFFFFFKLTVETWMMNKQCEFTSKAFKMWLYRCVGRGSWQEVDNTDFFKAMIEENMTESDYKVRKIIYISRIKKTAPCYRMCCRERQRRSVQAENVTCEWTTSSNGMESLQLSQYFQDCHAIPQMCKY